VRDINGDGAINDGSELFGEGTTLSNGTKARDGFEALADLDENGDGIVDAADSGFASLKVWQDLNADGVTDQGELKSLSELGIESLSVQARVDVSVDNGNVVALTASFTNADGSVGTLADVWFQMDADDNDSAVNSLLDALERYSDSQSASVDGLAGVDSSEDSNVAAVQASLLAGLQGFDQDGNLVGTISTGQFSSATPSDDPEEQLRKLQGQSAAGSLGQS